MLRFSFLGCLLMVCYACKAPSDLGKPSASAPKPDVQYYIWEKSQYRSVEQLEQTPLDEQGKRTLLSKVQYPAVARENRIMGTVVGAVYLDEQGRIEKTEIIRNIGAKCGEEWTRVMTQYGPQVFKPAIYQGKPVRSKIEIPITFRLG